MQVLFCLPYKFRISSFFPANAPRRRELTSWAYLCQPDSREPFSVSVGGKAWLSALSSHCDPAQSAIVSSSRRICPPVYGVCDVSHSSGRCHWPLKFYKHIAPLYPCCCYYQAPEEHRSLVSRG